MIIETTETTYLMLKECLNEIYPSIKVELISCDPALKALGFVKEVPCTIKVDATSQQLQDVLDLAIDFEVAAYNTPSGFDKKSEEYRDYERYGWLYDFFYEYV